MTKTTQNLPLTDQLSPEETAFTKKIKNPLLQRFFMLIKLPSAFFMGIKIVAVDLERATVAVPYAWRSQNPFRSTYFAAQAAAAEMSTGVLAMMALQGKGKISMLITHMDANYLKKANKKAIFVCEEGLKVRKAVKKAIQTGNAVEVALHTKGFIKDAEGKTVEISNFTFTWSFKTK